MVIITGKLLTKGIVSIVWYLSRFCYTYNNWFPRVI